MDNLQATKALVGFINVLGTDDSQLARLKPTQLGEDCWNQRTQVYEPLRRRPDEHNAERQPRKRCSRW